MTRTLVVSQEEVFDKYQVINNKPYAAHLTQFLLSKANEGYVFNLNAEWGAGKTTFLKCWFNELNQNHPVVYVDAWKSDFTKDPMLALMDAFHQQLISPLSENQELIKQFVTKGSYFIKTALPSLIVGYLKNKGGMDDDASLLTSPSEEFEITEDNLGDALKETMKAMLTQSKRVEGIEEFKDVLIELSDKYVEVYDKKNKPVFILIDELDRCRPTYAIELIECVKHFFNTKNFIFVLATDTNQLQHSIKSVYGANFDSLTYLSRFFDNSATLPTPNKEKFINVHANRLVKEHELHPKVLEFISTAFEWHDINSLREIQKVLGVIDIAQSQSKSYRIIVLILLSLLKHCFPEHFRNLKSHNKNPYVGRFGSREEDDIKGKPVRFKYTQVSEERAELVMHIALEKHWQTWTPQSFDEYSGESLNGQSFDYAACALINESLINKSLEQANYKEHVSLVDFAGYFNN